LENLRNSNASMADQINRLTAENEKLKQSINKISHIINKND
jgi:cell division protein FtsB